MTESLGTTAPGDSEPCRHTLARFSMPEHAHSEGVGIRRLGIPCHADGPDQLPHLTYHMGMCEDGEIQSSNDQHASVAALLTIGYGGERTSDEFLALLRRYGVKYLVDVRTKPYSKFRPEFSKEAIEILARNAGIVYVFMGDTLGGMPSDTSCYTEGKVDYTKVREMAWFKRGLDRLEHGWRSGHRLAIMCAELEPERCHRSKLVGEALFARGVVIGHIDEDGAVLNQQAVIDRVTGGQGALFDVGLTSRKRYGPAAGVDEEVA